MEMYLQVVAQKMQKLQPLQPVDIKTGEVLASASYPDYDPNLFVTGISSKDYEKLQPENPNDTLAASPLLNLVTQGVFPTRFYILK